MIPASLSELQIWFAKHITAPIKESDSANIPLFSPDEIGEIRNRISPGSCLTSEERLGIYRQQYWWRLISLSQEAFPPLLRLFGYEDFNRCLAEPYLIAHPPTDWFLGNLGTNLPKWVEDCYHGEDKALVLGLSAIDLAYESIFYKEQLLPITLQALSASETNKIYLQPHVALFECEADLFTFRSQLLEQEVHHWQTNDFPKLNCNGKERYFALYRSGANHNYEEISFELYDLLCQLKEGASLEELLPFLEQCENIQDLFCHMTAKSWLRIR